MACSITEPARFLSKEGKSAEAAYQKRTEKIRERQGKTLPRAYEKRIFGIGGVLFRQARPGFEPILVFQPLRFKTPVFLEGKGARPGFAAPEIEAAAASLGCAAHDFPIEKVIGAIAARRRG